MAYGKGKVSYFDKILSDTLLLQFAQDLTDSYFSMRFGERGFEIKNGKALVQALDEIVFNLDRTYLDITTPHIVQHAGTQVVEGKASPYERPAGCPFYVPDTIKEPFLKDNKFFSQNDISNQIIASIPMPFR